MRVQAIVPLILAACTSLSAQQTIPAGTPLEIRLTQRLSTQRSKKGTPVEAILAAPVVVGDKILLPLGSKVTGNVEDVDHVGLGFGHETAAIAFVIDRIQLPNGTELPVATQVAQIENSRETVDKNGRIHGVRSTSTLSHKASGALGTLALSNPVALIFMTSSSASVLRFSDPEVSLPANAELILRLTQPVTVDDAAEPGVQEVAETPASQQALRSLIRRQPYRTVTDPKHTPSDITNLMFVGDREAILRAFKAAGWMEVDSLDATSTYNTIRSVSEQKAYQAAPMSTLLLEGSKPTYALAKTLDTFSKRHHLRIFATQEKWDGDGVWSSSSTQDIGIGFSASQKTFIHQIDHNVDHERTKVVNDLMLTGCVTGLNLVQRPWIPKDLRNGTDEPIETDGRIAVIRINGCKEPQHVAPADQTEAVPVHSNGMTKGTRQTTLTLRNMVLRDNLGVTAYSGIKTALGMKHPKPPEQPIETNSFLSTNRYTLDFPGSTDLALHARTGAPSPVDEEPETLTDLRKTVRAPRLEIGVHGGFAGYAGGNGGGAAYILIPDKTTDPYYILALGNDHNNGFNLGGSLTLNTWRYFSNEIVFDYNRTGFELGFEGLGINGDETDPTTQSQFAFGEVNLSTTEVGYNFVAHLRPRESRFRPYIAVGPSLRLMHLTDAPVKKASPWFKMGLSTIGSIIAAYQFGTTPPLDGGGIFQIGLQYGAGVKYRVGRRWMLRAEYKETLTSQPDFWSKSEDEIYNEVATPDYSLLVIGPLLESAMRQQRVTTGISYVF